MTTFTWLHLTDLHCGMTQQGHLWPNIRDRFFNDLRTIYERVGKWDAVLFTGDLVQSGLVSEFDHLNKRLDEIWECFGRLGSNPILLAVPGNHDLVRPPIKSLPMRLLTKWQQNPEIHQEFWDEPDSEYRKLIDQAFSNYSTWWDETTNNFSIPIKRGLLPGDFSASILKDDIRVGIVGLNITFLQLTKGDYFRQLAFDSRQFHEACRREDKDSVEWIRQHHLSLLMTHQPPSWLDLISVNQEYGEIAPAGRFAVHLFGHMHEHMIHDESVGGGPIRRFRQGCSLFGMEQFGDGESRGIRQHGYSVHKIEISNGSAQMRMWPRIAKWHKVNGWQITADSNNFFSLEQDEGTPSNQIELVTPSIPGPKSKSGSAIKAFPLKSATRRSTQRGRERQELFNGWTWPHDEADLKEYCEALARAHGYIRFVEVPYLQDASDIEIDNLFVDPRFSTREIHADLAPANWPPCIDAVKAVQKNPHLVLLGDPGSGKSTMVSCLTWQLSRPKPSQHNEWTEALGGLLPIPIVLRELRLRADISWEGLLDAFLEHRIGRFLGTRRQVEELLDIGRVLILLDGLDEIGDLSTRRKLREAVLTGLSAYPSVRWIITSRIVGYEQVPFHIDAEAAENENLIALDILTADKNARHKTKKPNQRQSPDFSLRRNFQVLYLSPFSDQQISKFSQNWYSQHEPEASLVKEKSRNLVDAIHDNEGTQRLARIPYLLTLMALIHHKNAKLPHGRTELYDRIAAAYLDSIDARRELNQLPYSLAQKKLWLSEIAYQLQKRRTEKVKAKTQQPEILATQRDVQLWLRNAMKQSGTENAVRESKTVLDYFARRSGLLLPRGER